LDLERLLYLAIAIFAFMTLTKFFTSIKSYKRSVASSRDVSRIRRLIGSKDSALIVAKSIITEVADKYPDEINKSRKDGHMTEILEDALADAREYYLSRVERRYKTLFTKVVGEVIFKNNSDS